MNTIWPDIRKLARSTFEAWKFQEENRRRLDLIEQWATLRNAEGTGFYPGGDDGAGGVWHDVYVYGSCYGNLAVSTGDAFLYGVRQNTGLPANWEYYLIAIGAVNLGYINVFVGDYPVIYDSLGAVVPSAVPMVVIFSDTYASGFVALPSTVTSHTVFLGPLGSPGFAARPAVYISGTGTGAAISGAAGFPVIAQGSGYGLDTTAALGGYYGTGWGAEPQMGFLSNITVNDPGAGANFTAVVPVVALSPGGHNATIRGVVTNAQGLPTWTIVDGGLGMGTNGATVGFSVTAPTGIGIHRTASVSGTVTGNAVGGVLVHDPGIGYTVGATITGTAVRAGSGGGGLATVSGGSISAVAVTFGSGIGLTVPPNLALSLAGGEVFVTRNPSMTGTVTQGITALTTPLAPDLYGCFGTCGRPSKITGLLTSQFTTKKFTYPSGAPNPVSPTQTHIALGQVINTATSPNTYFANNHYYPVLFTFARDTTNATIAYTLTFASGVLTGVTITNPGYGYPTSPVFVIVGFPWILDFQIGAGHAAIGFTLNGSGSATGYSIVAAGSGYKTLGGATLTGTFGPYSVYESPGTEYTLTCTAPCVVSDVDGLRRPTGAAGSDATVIATVRASTYTCSPLSASFDFAGTPVDGPVFQTGSTVVNYNGT